MFTKIEFNEAAFNHGISRENIRYAIWHPIRERLAEGYLNKWMVIGYDTALNLLEIGYNIIDEDTVNVFHAMPCRKKYIEEINEERLWQE